MCNITVTSANRIRIGISFELYAIVLEGEKEDCSGDIAVSISSNPGVVASRDFIADINGNHWSVTIVLSETNELFETAFPCKSKIYVTPRCTTNEKCDANTTEITLRCEPPETRPEQPVLTCPTVASPLQANVANTCNNDGTRTVSVDITLNPVEGSLVTAELEIYPYQNGELSAFRATVDNDPNASTSNTLGGEIDLVPGDYRAVVDFSQPQPDCEVPALDFTVSACEVDIPEPEPRPNDTVQSVTCTWCCPALIALLAAVIVLFSIVSYTAFVAGIASLLVTNIPGSVVAVVAGVLALLLGLLMSFLGVWITRQCGLCAAILGNVWGGVLSIVTGIVLMFFFTPMIWPLFLLFIVIMLLYSVVMIGIYRNSCLSDN